MMDTVLISQPFGFGDVIWSKSISYEFTGQDRKVIWPVKKEWIEGLNRAYPDIEFVDRMGYEKYLTIKEKCTVDRFEIIPIRWSDSYMKDEYKNVMRNKYDMMGMDWRTWRNHAMWKRDHEKENSLMELLGIKEGDKYTFVNKRYGGSGRRAVDINTEGSVIEMTEIDGYSLFDWTTVILAASEIHTVSTSLLFMIEILDINCPIHLYVRKPIEKDFSFVDYIFTKNYILHD